MPCHSEDQLHLVRNSSKHQCECVLVRQKVLQEGQRGYYREISKPRRTSQGPGLGLTTVHPHPLTCTQHLLTEFLLLILSVYHLI